MNQKSFLHVQISMEIGVEAGLALIDNMSLKIYTIKIKQLNFLCI